MKNTRYYFILLVCGIFFSTGTTMAKSHATIPFLQDTIDAPMVVYVPDIKDIREELHELAKDVRFQYDSSVLPARSIAILDRVRQLILEQGDAYQFIIRVHSHEPGQSAEQALRYSGMRADALRRYLINQGVSSQVLLTQAMGSSKRKCPDEDMETDVDCYHKNNRIDILVQPAMEEE
ncbi:OmpA family protein [Sphingobacterium sp. DN00404]|uniref:OmpA family protein n=1 Tax=Sphingobacterium micropteri TaxID=2763501 RepID=A0ABR7YRF6_9SPHI|nr:OmpA family protein [Sphingobacterium micropteri]MBD1433912.1 OmpA family protein [Sphingobacterium micropteri]